MRTTVPSEGSGPSDRPRLLVVDDEPLNCVALVRMLKRRFDVATAHSGHEAMALLEEDDHFDAIVCDLVMPDGSGMDVFAWAEDNRPELARRMLFMSGGAVNDETHRFIERQKDRVFRKPYTVADLQAGVERVLAKG